MWPSGGCAKNHTNQPGLFKDMNNETQWLHVFGPPCITVLLSFRILLYVKTPMFNQSFTKITPVITFITSTESINIQTQTNTKDTKTNFYLISLWSMSAPVALMVASRYALPGCGDWRVWVSLMVSRNTTLVLSIGFCIGPASEAGVSAGMQRQRVPPQSRKKDCEVYWQIHKNYAFHRSMFRQLETKMDYSKVAVMWNIKDVDVNNTAHNKQQLS